MEIDSFYDHRERIPNIYSRFATIGDNIVKTPLARLLYEKYGECRFHYYNNKEYEIFKYNPYVTEFIKHDEEPNPSEYCIWPWPTNTINICHEWCHMYGFEVGPNIIPELFIRPDKKPTSLHGNKPLLALHCPHYRSWGIPHTDIIKLVEGLSEIFDIYQVGNDDTDFGVSKFGDNIQDLIEIISISDVFLGAESGPQHISTAFKIPSIIIAPNFHKIGTSATENWSYPHINMHIITAPDDICTCKGLRTNSWRVIRDKVLELVK